MPPLSKPASKLLGAPEFLETFFGSRAAHDILARADEVIE
jgi:hypothetical protein